MAISSTGRRHEDDSTQAPAQCIPILSHAGPSSLLETRPLGPSTAPTLPQGRRPLPLDAAGWEAFYSELERCAKNLSHRAAFLSVHDDGLLACTLSPRTNSQMLFDERLAVIERALAIVKNHVEWVGVVLMVEELCPGGLDPTDGISAAQALQEAGAQMLVGCGGTQALPALQNRPGHREDDLGDAFLASAAWLVGKVDVPVVAFGPTGDLARALDRAQQYGLSGVIAA